MPTFYVIRFGDDPTFTYAAPTLYQAADLADLEPSSVDCVWYRVESDDAGWARLAPPVGRRFRIERRSGCVRCERVHALHTGDCETKRGRRTHRRCKDCSALIQLYTSRDRRQRCRACIARDPKTIARKAREQRKRDEQRELERALLDLPLSAVNLRVIVTHLAGRCIRSEIPELAPFQAIYYQARFHGGVSGGELTLAYMASGFLGSIERESGVEARAVLETIAEHVAIQAYGSNSRARKAWRRAMYGS